MTDADEPRLQALLDGELDAAEAADLRAALRDSPAMRARLGELAMQRALLRQAYAGIRPPARTPAMPDPARRRGLLAATGLAAVALGAAGAAALWASGRDAAPTIALRPAPATGAIEADGTEHIVLHLSTNDAGQAVAVLERAEGLYSAAQDGGRALRVEIVANGSGLDLLRRATAPDAARVARMRAAHPTLSFVACGQTVQKLRERGDDVRLLPGTEVASSALDRIVARLQQGWTYLRL